MFTRVSVLGLGVGLVLVGCASPTDETADDTNEQALSPTTEAAPSEEAQDDATSEEGNVQSKADEIIVGPYGGVWGGGVPFYGTGFYGGGIPFGYGTGFVGRPFLGAPGLGWGGGWGGWGGGLYRGGWGWGGARGVFW